MSALLKKLGASQGYELLMNPDRFREVLVIILTGIGDHPGEVVQVLMAWFAAVLIASRIFRGAN